MKKIILYVAVPLILAFLAWLSSDSFWVAMTRYFVIYFAVVFFIMMISMIVESLVEMIEAMKDLVGPFKDTESTYDSYSKSTKKFRNKVKTIVVAAVVVALLIGFGVGYAVGSGNENVISSTETGVDEVNDDKENQEESESESQEQQSTASPVDLTTGTWTCGVDIEPGRYTATPVGGSGNLFIHGSVDVIEMLGSNPEYGQVPSVTFTIKEGDTIEISGLPAVHFEPVE